MIMQTTAESAQLAPLLQVLPRAESMECTNDPRFMGDSVILKRLMAFQTICIVSTVLLNLSKEQMFEAEQGLDMNAWTGPIQAVEFTIMMVVFVFMLSTVFVVLQQLFLTYRLLTVGPTGFEIAKSFYLNPNVVQLRHGVIKLFFFGIPLFVAGCMCKTMVNFSKAGPTSEGMWSKNEKLAMPCCLIMLCSSIFIFWMNMKHQSIFKENYALAKAHEEPLMRHTNRDRSQDSSPTSARAMALDV